MNTITLTTEIGAAAGTTLFLYDPKTHKLRDENAKNVVYTTIATGATALAANTIYQKRIDEIHEQYTTSYVDSMDDEQLAKALEQMDLLLPEETTQEDVKTL